MEPSQQDLIVPLQHHTPLPKQRKDMDGWRLSWVNFSTREEKMMDCVLVLTLKEAEPGRWKVGLVVEGWHYETPNFNSVKFVSYRY